MSGWKLEYVPVVGAPSLLTSEVPTLKAAIERAVDRGWARNAGEIIGLHGPGRSIVGIELKALLDTDRQKTAP